MAVDKFRYELKRLNTFNNYACDILKLLEQIVSAGGWCQVDKLNIGIKIFFSVYTGLTEGIFNSK